MLKRIEYRAFMNCQSLKSINLPKELEHIGDNCFSGSGISYALIPKTVKSIGKDALSSFKYIEIEEGCKVNITGMVGRGVSVQTYSAVRIPDGTRIITESQFSGKNVHRVFIPKSVEEI